MSVGAAGCGPREPYAAESSFRTSGEAAWNDSLSKPQQTELTEAFAEFAGSRDSHPRPIQADGKLRWDDVPLAVDYAIDDAEVAIVEWTIEPRKHVYVLKTGANEPGLLTIERIDGEEVYVAAAQVGAFGDDTTTARKLIAALAVRMKEASRKRRLPTE
jgi:hypothetical protein